MLKSKILSKIAVLEGKQYSCLIIGDTNEFNKIQKELDILKNDFNKIPDPKPIKK